MRISDWSSDVCSSDLMKEYSDGARGFIRVCANISAITQFLPQDIKSFSSAYPNIHVDLEEQVTPAIIKSIAENAVDVGIFRSEEHTSELQSLMRISYAVFCLKKKKNNKNTIKN